MLGRKHAMFLIPYFQFGKIFDFLFVYVMNTRRCVSLPGIVENSVDCRGKSWNFIIKFL